MRYGTGMISLALFDSITTSPSASPASAEGHIFLQEFAQRAARCSPDQQEVLSAVLAHPQGQRFLQQVFCYSPYLSQLIFQQFEWFLYISQYGIVSAQQAIMSEWKKPASSFGNQQELMRHLRMLKNQTSLLLAAADLLNVWPLETITRHLSELAEISIQRAVEFLLLDTIKRGEFPHLNPNNPTEHSGWFVLGMGKLGAYELNYSSDIDLIVLFDPDALHYQGKQTPQQCFNRMTRDLVHILQERTADGYVFRTDIRLRPDPGSTPPALSTYAAINYYETVGQNWERAAMIKARPVAGDKGAAEAYLKALTPFIWRKHLDFAAIADIHSIKRQIDNRTGGTIQVAGHNLKLGAGGIREIEFFVQVQQLIWGGKNPALRGRGTCETLYALATANIIDLEAAQELDCCYRFLRTLEHRVQMQRDQQTHSLPTDSTALADFARFAGYESLASFEAAILANLRIVKKHYTQLYGVEQSLGAEGNLVFTGVDPDPETVQTLTRMGYEQAESIVELIMNWHRGRSRVMRNKRARELLTELTPELLQAFAATAHPDDAFMKFDEFLLKLPSGVQIFSLFAANPDLLWLIAKIMGSAPRLAEILSRNPHLLDAVLTGAFYEDLPTSEQLSSQLQTQLDARAQFEDFVNILCQFKQEKEFQAGVHLISGLADCRQIGHYLSKLAELIISHVMAFTQKEFTATYGNINDGELAVLALGKLGARELTFASDLDLVFVYHAHPESVSDGARQFAASVYYNRQCQRIVGMLTAPTKEGNLYSVDTRLRPMGNDGPLAANHEGFALYFAESAWTFEYMAFTRARVVYASPTVKNWLEHTIKQSLTKSHNPEKLRTDASQMRLKINREFNANTPWDIKYARGGMLDIDFLAQYWQLLFAHHHPSIIAQSTGDVLARLTDAHLIDHTAGSELMHAILLYQHLQLLLRLCSDGKLDEDRTPNGLKKLLAEQFGSESFEELKATLLKTQSWVYNEYGKILGEKI